MSISSEDSDELLLEQYCQGDVNAFEILYQRYRKSLYIYLCRTCDNQAQADDCYQEVWSRVIKAKTQFKQGSFKAWVFQIARNIKIDLFRKQTLHIVSDSEQVEEAMSTDYPQEQHYSDRECHDRLRLEIAQLPAEQRDALLLKEEAGLTLEQIAKVVSVGRETIKSRLRYALKQLKKVLKDCL